MNTRSETAPPKVVVLLALFSSDHQTSLAMDSLLTEHISGLKKIPAAKRPQIHCLYRRFPVSGMNWLTWDSQEAYQFDLTDLTTLPLGQEQTESPATGTSATEQLSSFFSQSAGLVDDADKVVFVLGGHGQGVLGLSLIEKILFKLLGIDPFAPPEKNFDTIRSQSYFKRLLLEWLQAILVRRTRTPALWHSNSILVSHNKTGGKSIDMTIAQLATCMSGLDRKMDAAVFHTCFLSSLEVLHELRPHAEQFIACASRLYPTMHMSDWLSAICDPIKLPNVIAAEWVEAETDGYSKNSKPEGIFGAYVGTSTTDFVSKLELLGTELLKASATSETDDIRQAQKDSLVEQDQPIVDLHAFCDKLQAKSSLTSDLRSAAELLKNAISSQCCGSFQSKYSYRESITKKGISVHIPFRKTQTPNGPLQVVSFVSSLPDHFAADAPQWVAFLDQWAPQSYIRGD